jgi:hypothetical protein
VEPSLWSIGSAKGGSGYPQFPWDDFDISGNSWSTSQRPLRKWRGCSLLNFDFITPRVAASSGSFLTEAADAKGPVERAEAVRVTRSVLYMQEFPFRCLARVMPTPIAFVDWSELPTSIGRRRRQDVSACTFT